jgi:dihydrofolate reductase
MAKLIYFSLMSLDGYIEDSAGRFDWAVPDDEVHTFVNDLLRPLGTHLYGRRMYEVMSAWETLHEQAGLPAYELDFAGFWRAVDKIVFSTTLQEISSARTRIEREFGPEAVRRLKAQAQRDLSVSGPHLAAHAFEAGLVDACHLILAPVSAGSGKRAMPGGAMRKLELQATRRFGNGMVYLHYRCAPATTAAPAGS